MNKIKVIMLDEEDAQCRIILDSEKLEQESEFKYISYMLVEKETDSGKCAIKCSVNAKRLSYIY